MKRLKNWTNEERADFINRRGYDTYTDLIRIENELLIRRQHKGNTAAPWNRQERMILRIYI